MAAIKAGVNYFDTAYVYAGNEAAVGEILDRNHCRGADLSGDKAATLSDQVCRRCGKDVSGGIAQIKTDYIDYYLMHMLTDIPTWEKLKRSACRTGSRKN